MVEGHKRRVETRRRRKADQTLFQMNLQCGFELEQCICFAYTSIYWYVLFRI